MVEECDKALHTYGNEAAGQVVELEHIKDDHRQVHES